MHIYINQQTLTIINIIIAFVIMVGLFLFLLKVKRKHDKRHEMTTEEVLDISYLEIKKTRTGKRFFFV